MNVLVAGGTGFVGSALVPRLRSEGHRVSLLSRRPPDRTSEVPVFHWDPDQGALDAEALRGIGAVVNLAGENLVEGRWTATRKRRLFDSRVPVTRLLARRIAETEPPPRVLVNASAVGYYGNRGEEILTEESAPGAGFLAELCRRWEEAALEARTSGTRVTILRFGVVLGGGGGMLGEVLPIFRMGLGGPLGSGRQWMAWIARDDLVEIVALALAREELTGAINVVAPVPVRNRDFARTLGHTLGRPAILPAPAFALRLLFGPMADDAPLSSARVVAKELPAVGYRYRFGDLEEALRHALGG